MISVPSAVKVFVYCLPTDMRRSFDGLHSIVTNEFGMDVMDGSYFVFLNRALDRVKVLAWDRDGLIVWAKRLANRDDSNAPRIQLKVYPSRLMERRSV